LAPPESIVSELDQTAVKRFSNALEKPLESSVTPIYQSPSSVPQPPIEAAPAPAPALAPAPATNNDAHPAPAPVFTPAQAPAPMFPPSLATDNASPPTPAPIFAPAQTLIGHPVIPAPATPAPMFPPAQLLVAPPPIPAPAAAPLAMPLPEQAAPPLAQEAFIVKEEKKDEKKEEKKQLDPKYQRLPLVIFGACAFISLILVVVALAKGTVSEGEPALTGSAEGRSK
jgi:hypothetical protein